MWRQITCVCAVCEGTLICAPKRIVRIDNTQITHSDDIINFHDSSDISARQDWGSLVSTCVYLIPAEQPCQVAQCPHWQQRYARQKNYENSVVKTEKCHIYSRKMMFTVWERIFVSESVCVCMCVSMCLCLSVSPCFSVSLCLCVFMSVFLCVFVSLCLCVSVSLCLRLIVFLLFCFSVFSVNPKRIWDPIERAIKQMISQYYHIFESSTGKSFVPLSSELFAPAQT